MRKEFLNIDVALLVKPKVAEKIARLWAKKQPPILNLCQVTNGESKVWGWEGYVPKDEDAMFQFLNQDVVNAFHFESNGIEFYGHTFNPHEAELRLQLDGQPLLEATGDAFYVPSKSS